MSEERTQAPTRQRRQEARLRGQVARSPVLSASAGLLAAAVLLGMLGDDLVRGWIGLLRTTLEAPEVAVSITPAEAVDRLRGAASAVMGPLLGIAMGILATVVVVHEVQVGGLWAPGLLAPDASRLASAGGGIAARAGRGLWSVATAGILVGVAVLVIGSERPALARLPAADVPTLAADATAILIRSTRWMAVALVALGAADFALCWRQVEAALRQTPDEYREDLRAAEGDPALRSRRRKLARLWRRDPSDVLPGARVLLLGPGGLAVLLAGGPPPARVIVREITRGLHAATLRRAAEAVGVPCVEAPRLARHFARGRATGRSLPPPLGAELAAIWPTG
jgi:flagellar biosynthetic protein FlhB